MLETIKKIVLKVVTVLLYILSLPFRLLFGVGLGDNTYRRRYDYQTTLFQFRLATSLIILAIATVWYLLNTAYRKTKEIKEKVFK